MNAEAIARLREASKHPFASGTGTDVRTADLRALLDAYDAARAQGVAEERARVVAWLRSMDQLVYPGARILAGRCERGEHEEGT